MLAVIGTLPEPGAPLLTGPAAWDGGPLSVAGTAVDVARGTPALLAAASATALALGRSAPHAVLAGDIGRGDGSRAVYAHLVETLPKSPFSVLAFHYLQPDVDWHNKVLFAVQAMRPKPLLLADAGFMYAAKMSGQATEYDLFTPDAGELAFLADETAPHPFYARGFLLSQENRVPELIQRAHVHDNAARHLLVKGVTDHVARGGEILGSVDAPSESALEAMGGTGDTLTGVTAALIEAGWNIPRACLAGARVNRVAGALLRPTPASQVRELIAHIPEALETVLRDEGL
ncbi:MAG: NAD(P)H-hydrate dehydratase [Desulfovibrionaceae bacterium]|nr:NAD(P)H-hydrate dehydratase [Desulfovibrionaceae bacterium]